ncbi:MAG: CHY zinc finger protein, partial [Caulobacteraceae bacterium]
MRPAVSGVLVDEQTRCAHYRSPRDIIAIKMRCCRTYWSCRECHDEIAGHPAEVWPVGEWDEAAVLCGACGLQMSVREYLGCEYRCPHCRAPFNPACSGHHHLYFESAGGDAYSRARGGAHRARD